MMKAVLAFVFLLFCRSALAAEETVYELDFTQQPDGNAIPWLKQRGFEFKLQFESLNPRFDHGALRLSTLRPAAGVCGLTFPPGQALSKVDHVRLVWGVNQYPGGADWNHGVNRTSLAVMVSFGYERLSSGLPLGIFAAPPFICPFLGAKEASGQTFTGKFWKLGGRYISQKIGAPGETLVSELEINHLFQTMFKKDSTPSISAVGIQMNTKDTEGGADAFLKKICFLRGD